MQILRAVEMGMCFGVRDALASLAQIEDPARVTVHGELVHNREVLAMLDRRGFQRSPEAQRGVPATPDVLVTAHGISERERNRLLAAGKHLIDTTCPLVRRAHDAAQELERQGCRVVVIGRADHVEVRGLVEDLRDAIVVGRCDEVATWPETRLGVISQTTTAVEVAEAIVAAIRNANPQAELVVADTICSPTKARVAALDALLPRLDALVVVGGKDSNNTRQLVLRAERRSVPTLHVESVRELLPGWFDGRQVVGLTAGTSTLPRTIEAVFGWLTRLAAARRGPA